VGYLSLLGLKTFRGTFLESESDALDAFVFLGGHGDVAILALTIGNLGSVGPGAVVRAVAVRGRGWGVVAAAGLNKRGGREEEEEGGHGEER